jgi:hypothetical protein
LSFFDETDEPRPAPRRRRPAGAGRRPPTDQQAIIVRRAVAGVAILVVVIVMILGIHSCQVSSRNSALKNYNTSVASLIQRSDATGHTLFTILTTPNLASHQNTVTNELYTTKSSAQSELNSAQGLSAPDQVKTAQSNFVLTLSLRNDGISDIAGKIGMALNRSTAEDAVTSIATDMQEFLASDVVYTTQTAAQIAAALHAAGIPVGGSTGETIHATTFLPDLAWLTPSYIAHQLGSTLPASASAPGPNPCPSTCGHELNGVTVGGVALSTGGGSTIPASPAPTFTVNFANTGENTETHVVVQVTVTSSSGSTITAQAVQASTTAGQSYSLQVHLPKSPPTGQAQVVVKVEAVPGESNLNNNVLTFPVTFD